MNGPFFCRGTIRMGRTSGCGPSASDIADDTAGDLITVDELFGDDRLAVALKKLLDMVNDLDRVARGRGQTDALAGTFERRLNESREPEIVPIGVTGFVQVW